MGAVVIDVFYTVVYLSCFFFRECLVLTVSAVAAGNVSAIAGAEDALAVCADAANIVYML